MLREMLDIHIRLKVVEQLQMEITNVKLNISK